MTTITLYTKPGCHLCDIAKDILAHLQKEFEFTIQEINIETDTQLNVLYQEKIPVIHINDEMAFYGRLSENALRKKLENIQS